MPCYKCSNGKWRIGTGRCQYKSEESCKTALAAYYARTGKKEPEKEGDNGKRKSRDNN